MPSNITAFPLRLQLPVAEIAAAVQALIDLLDKAVGDPDCDEDDAEDAFAFSLLGQSAVADAGPGCPIADPDAVSSPEWHTLDRFKGAANLGLLPPEDAELDDDDSGGDEAEPNFARIRGDTPGCAISDADYGGEEAGEEEEGV